jgi:hypothetical protein
VLPTTSATVHSVDTVAFLRILTRSPSFHDLVVRSASHARA